MHYSAKRGLAIACRPSICLSVPSATLVDQDHIGWKSWKLIARTISPPLALFVAYRGHPRTPTGTGEILGRPEVGWRKVVCWSHCWSTKAAISLKRVKIDVKLLLYRAYRNSFERYHPRPPTAWGLLFARLGIRNPDPKLQSKISGKRMLIEE